MMRLFWTIHWRSLSGRSDFSSEEETRPTTDDDVNDSTNREDETLKF